MDIRHGETMNETSPPAKTVSDDLEFIVRLCEADRLETARRYGVLLDKPSFFPDGSPDFEHMAEEDEAADAFHAIWGEDCGLIPDSTASDFEQQLIRFVAEHSSIDMVRDALK
jgi:hypothetical protein